MIALLGFFLLMFLACFAVPLGDVVIHKRNSFIKFSVAYPIL